MQQPDVIITLVHGTWGRGLLFVKDAPRRPRWFERGGAFYEKLTHDLAEANISANVTEFLWSGSNSVTERSEAAQRLSAHIKNIDALYPDSYQYIIAHSYGGNVVLNALSDDRISNSNINICYMATPFLDFFRGNISRSKKFALSIYFIYTSIILIAMLTNLITLVSSQFFTFPDWIMYIYILLCQGIIAGSARAPFYINGDKKYNQKIEILMQCSARNSPMKTRYPPLIIRSVDDEASLAISAGTAISLLSHFTAYVCGILIILIILFLVTNTIIGLYSIPINIDTKCGFLLYIAISAYLPHRHVVR